MRSLMLGGGKVKAGGAVVLAGNNWYSPLFVEMDMETEGAFQVETISLLAGCLIAEEMEVTISTDCKGAMAAEGGRNQDFNRILGGWERGKGISIKKVKAHPERREGEWTEDDEGIFLADQVAGGKGDNMPRVRATEVIGEIARRGRIMICGEDGVPFVGNIRARCSREKMRNYWKRRDEYRNERGKVGIWEGTRLDMSHKMMGKGGSIEDRSAVQRMAGGKRWCTSWTNTKACKACGKEVRSESHALKECRGSLMVEHRKGWTGDVSKVIRRIRDINLRGLVEETWTRMRYRRGGEMAMMGCFQPRWVDTIYKGRMPLNDGEDRIVKRIFRVIGEGAREMINFYYRNERGMKLDVVLRQTNIRGFFGRGGKGIDMPPGTVVRGGKKKKRSIKDADARKTEKKTVGYTVVMDGTIIYWEFKRG